MIQCHTFNSLARLDLRNGGAYVISQFVGGMAAPLFLFMAGMTGGFQMESLDRREPSATRRWWTCLRHAGYILAIALTFRFTNWLFSMPHASWHELTKVDILNCMGVGLAALSVAAIFPPTARVRFAVIAGILVAAVSPLLTNLNWSATPPLLQEYLVPGQPRGHFPFFPWVAYIAFGQATGDILKRAVAERLERLMQWSVLIGFGLILGGQYFSNVPYSLYAKSSFWTDSPGLIVIRVGLMLLLLAGAYLWTEYCSGPGWSWLQAMGKNSLMVYWIHVMIVYGAVMQPFKRTFSIGQTAGATVLLTLAMVAMSALWLKWKERRAMLANPMGQPSRLGREAVALPTRLSP
jgi:uncharacterized membrane protein